MLQVGIVANPRLDVLRDALCSSSRGNISGALQVAKPQWQAVLDFCARVAQEADSRGRTVGALVDAGGLMAGAPSNAAVAGYLLRSAQPPLGSARFQGVLYFDHLGDMTWKVLDRFGRCLPLHSSPIKALDAFAFFDESRCRGADLKLRLTTLAIVTAAPGVGKDK